MDQQHENFQKLLSTLYIVLHEIPKSRYLPDWVYKFWRKDDSAVDHLIVEIKNIEIEAQKSMDIPLLENKLIQLLDQERYLVAVHLADEMLLHRIEDAMETALFFTQTDVKKYDEYILVKQEPKKFLDYLNHSEELANYKDYLKKQQSVYGRFMKNFTDAEIDLAAKTQMINGKLFDNLGLNAFLKHGFHYIKQELKALSMKNIEKGYLNRERIDSYLEKISFLLHPANELQQNQQELVKQARYILEDIINTAGIKEHGVPEYPEHKDIINGCYWVDELFKTAAAEVELAFLS